jgi:hypothetical protein
MADEFFLPPEPTALDIDIRGTIGSFSVRPHSGEHSISVRYIETRVRFSMDGSTEQKLFENLVPVREVFELRELDFDDLMQRDIDDSRVSNSLIPYLVSMRQGGTVKFFPPIVTVALPIKSDKRPADYYDITEESKETINGASWVKVRSGSLGKEIYEFTQLERSGELSDFDWARLKVNSSRCKLVIVDGQHRAMALLALYRNFRGWPDNTAAVRNYYERWSKETVGQIDLSHISLPMVVCVFPELDGHHGSPVKVTKACRSLFLALNKNARPVSTSRNILLDDYDLIAHFLRSGLEKVKSTPSDAAYSLRLHNFELDSDENRTVLTSTVALSGVMHLYTALERAMLLSNAPKGLTILSQRFRALRTVEKCLERLDGNNILGSEIANATTRNSFTPETLEKLLISFGDSYGKVLNEILRSFAPYEAMSRASLYLEQELVVEGEKQCHAMLFEGQGMFRVFDEYIEELNSDLKERYPLGNVPPELAAIRNGFVGTRKKLDVFRVRFEQLRAQQYLAAIASSKVQYMRDFVTKLYSQIFTTIAFQTALLLTFTTTIEKLNKSELGSRVTGSDDEMKLLEEYLKQISTFFLPDSEKGTKAIFAAFLGNVTGSFGTESMSITPNAFTLREIVIPGELKPDEWFRFRYILLELWNSQDSGIQSILKEYRSECRKDVIHSAYDSALVRLAKEKGVEPTEIKKGDLKKLSRTIVENFFDGLKHLGVILVEDERTSLAALIQPADDPLTPTQEYSQKGQDR